MISVYFRINEDDDDAPVAWLQPGTASDWARYQYMSEVMGCQCCIECGKSEMEMRPAPIMPY